MSYAENDCDINKNNASRNFNRFDGDQTRFSLSVIIRKVVVEALILLTVIFCSNCLLASKNTTKFI